MSGGPERIWVSRLTPAPLVLMRTNLLASWSGVAPTRSPSDFERASRVPEIGTIPVGVGEALVLGGQEVLTTWIPGPTGGMLVRWLSAKSEEEVLRAAATAMDSTWTPTGCRFTARAGDHVLFNARLSGAESSRENITLKLSSGSYDVTSAMVGDHPTSVFVYRLTWRPELGR